MKTRIWLIALPLLGVAGGAFAQSAAPEAPATEPAVATGQTPAKAGPSGTRPRQGGDLRRCLDKRDDKAVIRCAEQGRKPARRPARKH